LLGLLPLHAEWSLTQAIDHSLLLCVASRLTSRCPLTKAIACEKVLLLCTYSCLPGCWPLTNPIDQVGVLPGSLTLAWV
jgi:hypothetical protein